MFFELIGYNFLAILVVISLVIIAIQMIRKTKKESGFDVLYWKKFGLSLAIVIMLPAVIQFGLKTFYPEPLYTDYVEYSTQTKFNKWDLTDEQKASPEYEKYIEQDELYLETEETHRDITFVTTILLGVVALVGGLFLRVPAAGSGLMYGGVFTIIPAYFGYFEYMSDPMVFISTLLVLLGLLYFAWKKFGVQIESLPQTKKKDK